jgi:hypothetical protein
MIITTLIEYEHEQDEEHDMNQNEEHCIDHTKYLQDVLDLQLQALPSS